MRIDAHQHFWKLSRGDYGWLTPELAPIYRDFLPPDLAPLLERSGVAGTVLVQAAPSVAETGFMLSLARDTSFIKGVVGWVDFEADDAAQTITSLAKDPALVGLRPMIQDIEDDGWMLRPALAPAFEALIAQGLTFDALTLPRHLRNLRELLARYPAMRVVIDHASKPLIAQGEIEAWKAEMTALARESSAWCKLSGLVTEACEAWSVEKLAPYVTVLLEAFGPERLIWGSDWPVCTLAASYAEWDAATDELLAGLSAAERNAVLGGNAARAYRLG